MGKIRSLTDKEPKKVNPNTDNVSESLKKLRLDMYNTGLRGDNLLYAVSKVYANAVLLSFKQAIEQKYNIKIDMSNG